MKKAILFIVLLVASLSAGAQKTTIKGVLVDSITHVGEPYATVKIFKGKVVGVTPLAIGATDLKGKFVQSVSGKGQFLLFISAVGRKNVVRVLNVGNTSVLNLDTLYITDDVKTLKNITVSAQKPLVNMTVDKMTYSVSNDVDAKSSTVLDMLRKVPMVTVDGQDNITVNGSSSFKVYVDGKPNVMMSSNPSQVFKVMPASAVKDIEVITNPGAKYDAEGVGGVLNLVMNKVNGVKPNMNSSNATVRVSAGNKGVGGGVYASMQEGKLSVSVNANINHQKIDNSKTSFVREQIASAGNSYTDNSQTGDYKMNYKMGDMSLSYEIDSLRLISASFGLMGNSSNNVFTGHTSMTGYGYGSGFGYGSIDNSKNSGYSVNGSIDYQRSFARCKDRMLTLSYLVSTSPGHNKSYNLFDSIPVNTSLNLTDRYTNARNNTVEHTFQVDYTTPLNKYNTLDAGLKYILRSNTSKSNYYTIVDDVYTMNDSTSLNYKNNNDILAAYAEYSLHANKLSGKAGLRYEHTWQSVKYIKGIGSDFNLNYGNLVPSANISYSLGQSSNIGLTYNLRISRPGISMLNPYVDKSDPTALSYGNTNLKCEEAHNISAVYNLFTSKWMVNLTLRQSFCNNAIEQYSFYKNNLLNTTYGNVGKNSRTGLNAYINWNATPKTRFTFNGSVSYNDMRSDALGYSNSGWQSSIMCGLQQTLPWKVRASLNLMSSTKSYNLQGYSTGFEALMGSLSRSFCKDRLNISVFGLTPLSGSTINMKSYTTGKNYTNRSDMEFPLRILSFSLSYTFGRQTMVKKAQHSITNEDIKNTESKSESVGNMIEK